MRLGGRRFLLSLAIIGAAICLAFGIARPIIRIDYVLWSTEHSLIGTVEKLLSQNQIFLGITVLVFSILLPILKLLYLLLVSTLSIAELKRHHRQLRALEWLGKWSMHDVLVLALTIFFIKTQGYYGAASLPGVYYFTAAVLLMILSYAWLQSDGRTQHTPQHAPLSSTEPQQGLPRSEIKTARPLRNFVLSLLIILSTISFALGLTLPVIQFTTAYALVDKHSIVSIIESLFDQQEYFLTAVLALFSILFPFLKLLYLLTLVTSPDLPREFRQKSFATMEWLGRYSMTDVMVLALMIFYMNSKGYTEASVQPGVYYFAASVMLTMLAYAWANYASPEESARQVAPPHLPPPRPRHRASATAPSQPSTENAPQM